MNSETVIASPFNSWLVLRGVRTLAARMRVHSQNALTLASFLELQQEISQVLYPGLPSHGGYAVAKEQMSEFGGMLSVRIHGGVQRAIELASRLQLFTNAGSLGGPESLVQHAVSVMHPTGSIPDDLLRLSVGLEHSNDLIEDFRQAFAVMGRAGTSGG
jgi:cystathionine gamma-synthase